MSESLRKKRGQAAVEFLTTYGWAIIGVLVVVGALSYFGLLDTKRFVSERCEIGTQLQCNEMYVNDNGDFKIELRNNYPVNLIIEKIYVSGSGNWSGSFSLGSGNVSTFQVAPIAGLVKNTKKNFDVIIQFKRDNPVAIRSYNVSGLIVAKVQDHLLVPLP